MESLFGQIFETLAAESDDDFEACSFTLSWGNSGRATHRRQVLEPLSMSREEIAFSGVRWALASGRHS